MKETLYIFDVDDTLIDTKACIRAIDEEGNVVFRAGTKVFNAPDSTERLLSPGLTWDFTEFESLEQIMFEPKLPAFNALENAYNVNTIGNIHIVTARQKQVMLGDWLSSNGIDLPLSGIHCYDRSSGLSVADWKAAVVKKLLEQNRNIKKVALYEDDPENIKSIKGVCEEIIIEIVCNQVLRD